MIDRCSCVAFVKYFICTKDEHVIYTFQYSILMHRYALVAQSDYL